MNEREFFVMALACPTLEERDTYLRDLGISDPAMAQRVRALLHASNHLGDETEVRTGSFFEVKLFDGNSTIPREVAGRYKLHQKLGEGGMGVVWAAEQTRPVRRLVAIKLLREQVIAAGSHRFAQECQALALMEHPNIAKVYDVGVDIGGEPYLAMELVKGTPLTRYCDVEGLGIRDRLRLFTAVCRAIQHAHQKGIIHRDLKPSNILVGLYDGQPMPKVIDFGVAKAIGGDLLDKAPFTMVGSIVGTLAYMAPEQAELNNLDIDTRADVYSLGVLLYELLVGSTPHADKLPASASILDQLQALRDTDLDKPSTRLTTSAELPAIARHRGAAARDLCGMIEGELDWIAMKCLERERQRRYQSPEEIALDIERYLDQRPVSASPPSWWYATRKFASRHRVSVAFVIVVAMSMILVTGLSAAWAIQASKARDEASEAQEREQLLRSKAERAAADARRSAEDAQALLAFLHRDVLGQANVGTQVQSAGPRSQELTVREALDRVAQRIDKAFPQQPLLEANLRHTLGSTYLNLGLPRQALEHLTQALNLRQKHLGSQKEETLVTRQLLAMTYHALGESERAEKEQRNVVQLVSKMEGSDAALFRSMARNALANVLIDRNKHAEAKQLLEAVAGDYQQLKGSDDPRIFAIWGRLGEMELKEGNLEAAVQRYEAAHASAVRYLGQDHPLTISLEANLASASSNQGQLERADRLFAEVLARAEKVWSRDRAKLADIRQNAAAHAWKKGDREAALEQLTLAVSETGTDPNFTRLRRTLFNAQAEMLLNLERFSEAETIWKQLVSIYSSETLTRSAEEQSLRERLIDLYARQQQWKQVELLSEILLRGDQLFLSSPALFTKVSAHQALARFHLLEQSSGLLLLDATRERIKVRFGASHPITWHAVTQVLALHERAGNWKQIETIAAEQLKLESTGAVVEVRRRAVLTAWRGRASLAQGFTGAAVLHLSAAVELFEQTTDLKWQQARAQFDLGRSLISVEGPSSTAASDALLRGWEGMRKSYLVALPEDRQSILSGAAAHLLDQPHLGNTSQRNDWKQFQQRMKGTHAP